MQTYVILFRSYVGQEIGLTKSNRQNNPKLSKHMSLDDYFVWWPLRHPEASQTMQEMYLTIRWVSCVKNRAGAEVMINLLSHVGLQSRTTRAWLKNNKVSTQNIMKKINKPSTSAFNEMDAIEIVLAMELHVMIWFILDKPIPSWVWFFLPTTQPLLLLLFYQQCTFSSRASQSENSSFNLSTNKQHTLVLFIWLQLIGNRKFYGKRMKQMQLWLILPSWQKCWRGFGHRSRGPGPLSSVAF